jgi:hypothetical protein
MVTSKTIAAWVICFRFSNSKKLNRLADSHYGRGLTNAFVIGFFVFVRRIRFFFDKVRGMGSASFFGKFIPLPTDRGSAMGISHQIDVKSHQALHEREWKIQRIGWAIWALIIVAALAGLVGPGPLSSTVATSADGTTTVAFDQYLHYHHPTTLELTLRPTNQQEVLQVAVSKTLLDSIEIRRIEPEPRRCLLQEGGVVYTFDTTSSTAVARIVMHVEYQKFGNVSGEMGLVGQPPIQIRQFVYP